MASCPVLGVMKPNDKTATQLRPAPADTWHELGLRFRATELECGRIAYVDEGSGPVILLLHGAPVTSLGFMRVIRGLRDHHRVIAPDLPGFGFSSCASGFGGTLREYAQFVREFCVALDLRDLVIYVNDSSGSFGLAAAADLGSRVRGLVVADTVPIPLTGLAWPVKLVLKHVVTSWLVRVFNRRFNLLAWAVATLAPLLHPFTRAERRALIAQFPTPQRRDRILDLFSHMARDESFMHAAADAARRQLANTPALILYGQFDPMRVVGGVSRFQSMFRNSRVCIVPWEEHFPILASGGAVADLVHTWATDELRVSKAAA